MKIVPGILGGLALASGAIGSGGATAQEGQPGGPFEDLRTRIEVLENRVEFMEQALSGLQGALAGLTCPDGQFVRGFNASGDLLCAAPTSQGEPGPGEPIPLPDLAAALQAKLNELLAPNEFLFEDISDEVSLAFGASASINLTDLALRLNCFDQCVATLQATTTGNGTTLNVDYEVAGPVEFSGAADIVLRNNFNQEIISDEVTFVLTWEKAAVHFDAEIDQADGSLVSGGGSFSTDTTDLEREGGAALPDIVLLPLANFFISQVNSAATEFLADLHAAAIGDLEPIELPGAI